MSYLDQILPQDSKSAQILSMANQAAATQSLHGDNDRNARIAEIDKRIAELNNKIANWDGEGAIARYKFVYENDPSAYLTRFQNLRTHEQAKELADINHKNAMELQRESQKKTESQQHIDSWKQNSIDLENQRYILADAERKYNEAVAARDSKRMAELGAQLNRERAVFKRLQNENEAIRAKVSPMLFGDNAPAQVETPTGLDESMQGDVAKAEAFNKFKNEVSRIDSSVSNKPLSKKQKADYIKNTNAQLDQFENMVMNSDMLEDDKKALYDIVDAKRKELGTFSEKQGTVKTAADYEKAVAGKTRGQIRKNGVKWLQAAKKAGANIADIDAIIQEATKLGYK